MKKKCPKCKQTKTVDQYSKNRSSTDGFTCYCNQCNRETVAERRKGLEYLSKNIPDELKTKFKKLHSEWIKKGCPPHLKPVLSMGEVMTKIESKPKRRGRSVEVFHMRDDGELHRISRHDSIKVAVDIYGTTYQKIKYSSESGMAVDEKYFKINFE